MNTPENQLATAQPQALATKPKPTTVRGWIESPDFQAQIAKALPKHLTPDRMTRVALTALMRTPKLADCSVESVCKALLDCSAVGLEPDGRRAHLIPYGNVCTLILDYKGLAELVMRSGLVSTIHADVICDADFFEADTGRISHKVNYREPRGQVYAAFCLIRFRDGSEKSEVMTREEIEAIRKRSKAGQSGPWVTDWNEMAKKTVARRAFKWVPLSPEIRDAVESDADAIDVTPRQVEIKKPLFASAKPVAEEKPVEPVPPDFDAQTLADIEASKAKEGQ